MLLNEPLPLVWLDIETTWFTKDKGNNLECFGRCKFSRIYVLSFYTFAVV